MNKIELIAKIIKEAKTTSEKFKNQNGNTSLRVSNKDLLIWLAGKTVEQDTRILNLETKVKMLLLFIPVVITLAILL